MGRRHTSTSPEVPDVQGRGAWALEEEGAPSWEDTGLHD